MYCYKANYTTDSTLHRVKKMFACVSLNNIENRIMFQIRVVDLSEVYIPCNIDLPTFV
jgi:hypothetical protein